MNKNNDLKTNFSKNWNNKLDCDCFTTLRLSSSKYQVGQIHEIILDGKHKKFAKIIEIKSLKLSQINEFIGHLDTGMDAKATKELMIRMYSKYSINWETKQLYLILFKTQQ